MFGLHMVLRSHRDLQAIHISFITNNLIQIKVLFIHQLMH